MRATPWLITALSLSLTLGCQLAQPTRPATGKSPRPAATDPVVTRTTGEELTRIVDQRGTALELTGKVKLISDKGSGIISNNSSGLVSDQGGGIISGNTGNLVANNGAGLTGKVKLRVLADAPKASEALLSDALVEVMDAGGHVLTDADGKPLSATTDGTGAYSLKAVLPVENLVLRVRLNVDADKPGGQLKAILPKDRPATAEPVALDLDTAATLGTAYVLKQYVHGSQAVFDRLPGEAAVALRHDVEAARVAYAPDQVPDYREDALVSNVESLRAKAAPLSATLDRIEAILVAGQKGLGAGLKATEVGLASPYALALDPQGNLLISEYYFGRVRRVSPDGLMSLYADGAAGELKTFLGGVKDMRYAPDGMLYIAETEAKRVRRISPSGEITVVAGGGQTAGVGGPASEAAITPSCLALGTDGTVYIGELRGETANHGRVLSVDAAGRLGEIPTTEDFWGSGHVEGIEVASDGTLWAILDVGMNEGLLVRRPAGGNAWQVVTSHLGVGNRGGLRLASDGSVVVSEDDGDRVIRVTADGRVTVLAGTGTPGYGGDGGPATAAVLNEPTAMVFGPDGSLFITDYGNALVRVIRPDGKIETVAGARGVTQQGDAVALAVGSPAGVAVDPAGMLLFSELATSTVKRFDGHDLTLVAGSTKGFSGDGGPATEARFSGPGGMVYIGQDLYVSDSGNGRIRKIDASGVITTVVGTGDTALDGVWPGLTPVPALKTLMHGVSGLAVGPDGLLYWTSSRTHQVLRLNGHNEVEIVAGQPQGADGEPVPGEEGDGGPARAAKLHNPFALAFAPSGDLYIAELGNFRVRRISGLSGDSPRIDAAAGMAKVDTFARLLDETPVPSSGDSALSLPLAAPTAIAVGADGAIYIGEAGTANAGPLLGSESAGLPLDSLPVVPGHIRRIAPDGSYTTVAGPGGHVLTDASGDQALNLIGSLTIDRQGRLIIADVGSNQIKLIPKAALNP